MDTHELATVIGDATSSVVPTPSVAPTGVEDDTDVLRTAVIADFIAGWKMEERGELEQYHKHHVAILNGTVVGFDKDCSALWDRMIEEQKIPRDRLVIIFVGDDTI